MKTREEVAAFIKMQLDENRIILEKSCWHYGRVELRELMDFIYESEPTSDSEQVE